jgi:hypothetical protein
MCRTPSAHIGIGSIPDFLWSGVKLPIWLPALLSTITCLVNVQMAHARPFSTSTLQGLSNGIKNTSRRGVWPSAVELWSCGSLGGLQIPTFESVSLILTLASKWGCDKLGFHYVHTHKFNPLINQRSTLNLIEFNSCKRNVNSLVGIKGLNKQIKGCIAWK